LLLKYDHNIYIYIYYEAVSNATRKYKSFELAVNASKKRNKLEPSENVGAIILQYFVIRQMRLTDVLA
jgi:hypothetical protein